MRVNTHRHQESESTFLGRELHRFNGIRCPQTKTAKGKKWM